MHVIFQFNLLSPSLFSLHDEGTGVEKLMSLPHLLKKLDNNGQNAWLDFIVEAAGSSSFFQHTSYESFQESVIRWKKLKKNSEQKKRRNFVDLMECHFISQRFHFVELYLDC